MPLINKFGGVIPKMSERSLSLGMAIEARDVSLRNGRLEPWREKAFLYAVDPTTVSFYMSDCCLYSWPSCVQATSYLPDYARLYISGRSSRAEVTKSVGCEATYTYLGVPTPANALTVSGTETTGDDSDARSYVYTYINRYGEESAPSPPSRQLTIKDGATVQVSGFAAPPEGWGIVGIVLYRSVTGSRMEEDLKNQTLITSYFVVWTGAWTSEVTDAVLTRHLGAILYTDEVRVPPEGLRHIQHLNGTGFLIGATANQVHFSEEYMPWSWPDKYDLSFPSHIVNMVSVDATIFVSTDGRPYVIDASSACDPEKRNVIRDADTPLPDVACGQPRSAVATPFGMIYNSADGLVLFKTDASWQLITTPWFSPTEWRRHKLDATRLAFWQGKIICAMDDICYVLELDAENYRTSDIGHLSTISDKPSDMMVSSNGELLMLEDNVVWQFDASENLRNFFWRSAAFDVDGDVSLTTLKVKSEGVLATIETPYPDVRYSRYVSDDKPVRIKRLGRHGEYRLTLEGRHPVEYAELGTAVMTVSKGI